MSDNMRDCTKAGNGNTQKISYQQAK